MTSIQPLKILLLLFLVSANKVVDAFKQSFPVSFGGIVRKNHRTTRPIDVSLRITNIDLENDEGLTYDPEGPRVVFKGQKGAKKQVVEDPNARTLLEYLALPAEKYSILDAGTITKDPESKNTFTCVLDPINFLGNTIIAEIHAEVNVSPFPEGKSVIKVTDCTLDGSKLAKFANGSFDVTCENVVRALREDKRKQKDVPILSVDCALEVSALVPREGRWLPKRLLSKSGSIVMQQMLNVLVPRFVNQLRADFQAWSLGDDSRSPVPIDQNVTEEIESGLFVE